MTDKQFIYMLMFIAILFGTVFFLMVKHCHSPECAIEIGEITHIGFLK